MKVLREGKNEKKAPTGRNAKLGDAYVGETRTRYETRITHRDRSEKPTTQRTGNTGEHAKQAYLQLPYNMRSVVPAVEIQMGVS